MARLIDADELFTNLDGMMAVSPTGYIHGDTVADMISDAPTVEAEPKWIPVTERLPRFHEAVLVTTKKEEGFEPITVGHFYKNPYGDDIMFDDFLGTCGRYVSTDILAWMPLPEPYEVKEE